MPGQGKDSSKMQKENENVHGTQSWCSEDIAARGVEEEGEAGSSAASHQGWECCPRCVLGALLTPSPCPLRPHLRKNSLRDTGFGLLGQASWPVFPPEMEPLGPGGCL